MKQVSLALKLRFSFKFSAMHAFALLLPIQLFATSTAAQTAIPAAKPPSPSLEKQFLRNIGHDEAAIFTAPFRLRQKDADWLAPFGIAAANLIATDRQTADALSHNRNLRRASNAVSEFGSGYSVGAIAGGFYLFGRVKNDARARETGLLAGEALIDSGIFVTVVKTVGGRARPLAGARRSHFFVGGNSFPSGHSAAAWSLATVIAHEYNDQPAVKYAAYALATAVSISRFTARKHFLGDALVGSAIGYGIGRYVYRTHHAPNLAPTSDQTLTNTSKFFPIIIPHFDSDARFYGATLTWNF